MNGEMMPETLVKESVVEDNTWDSLLNQRPTHVLSKFSTQYQPSVSLLDPDQDGEDLNYDQDLQEQYVEEPQSYPQDYYDT